MDFDLDKNSATGDPGLIDSRQNQHSTDLGVEVSWECHVDADLEVNCDPPTESAYTAIEGFFEQGFNETRIVFLLPRDDAGGLLGVGDMAHIAFATQDVDFGGEAVFFDVLPNGDSGAVPPVPPFVISDFDVPILELDPSGHRPRNQNLVRSISARGKTPAHQVGRIPIHIS